MKKGIRSRNQNGFTLIEVIVIIVIGAILAAFLVTFMGTAITQSSVPVNQTRDLGTSIGSLETITAAYAAYLRKDVNMYWSDFKIVCGNPVSINIIVGDNIETVPVTVTTGDQKLTSYFMR
jgi:prepilin-type N-terminal cleavage/methylation domain-containing protein